MSSTARLITLLFFLFLMIVALFYDRTVARPKSEEAEKICMELVHENASMKGKPTNGVDEVQSKIGTPASIDKQELYEIHRHSWRRGFVLLTYNLNVVYARREGKLILQHAYLNTEVPEESIPKKAEIVKLPPGTKPQTPPGVGPGPGPVGPGPGIPGANPGSSAEGTSDGEKKPEPKEDTPKPDSPKPDDAEPDNAKPDDAK